MASRMPADAINQAARVLRDGGLVAFPTETVYGLAADARSAEAVRRIFAVKGRPTSHPLIVHVGSARELDGLARAVSSEARELARRFWPGPLTLVVEHANAVVPAVTGGLSTVGVRVPAHPLALELLREFGGPVAAPSANRFGRVSPTSAAHVRADLGNDVDFILDGGSSAVGVESTIVDVTREPPRVLRLGGLAVEDVEAALGVPLAFELHGSRAPGQLPSHYAPKAEVVIVSPLELAARAEGISARGARVCLLIHEAARQSVGPARIDREIVLPSEPSAYARELYAALRALDEHRPDVMLVVLPDERGVGRAVADRVRRAASPR